MKSEYVHILLADDDKEDCLLFLEALREIKLPAQLTLVHDGEQLIKLLRKKKRPDFDVIFLDLNMPRLNGLASLAKIKNDKKLQHIPVIIFTTAYDQDIINQVYKDAAHYYIQKPTEFIKIKQSIRKALSLVIKDGKIPKKEKFILTSIVKPA